MALHSEGGERCYAFDFIFISDHVHKWILAMTRKEEAIYTGIAKVEKPFELDEDPTYAMVIA